MGSKWKFFVSSEMTFFFAGGGLKIQAVTMYNVKKEKKARNKRNQEGKSSSTTNKLKPKKQLHKKNGKKGPGSSKKGKAKRTYQSVNVAVSL